MKNIGIDIGGTFIKAAIVENNGNIIISSKTPTPKEGTLLADKVIEIIDEIVKKSATDMNKIKSIGIGAPGVCDSKKGVIVSCPNIEGCKNISICSYIEKKTGIPTLLDNDANCAALGEYMVSDKRADSFVFVTLGTGVGGGIILDGKILRGINSAAGEIGHIVIDRNGERCNCGRYGCWERYASVSALVRQAKAAGLGQNVTGKSIFAEKYKGNKRADEVIEKWLSYVSEGICDMVNIFQSDEIVIGGGISREGDAITDSIKRFAEENSITDKNETRRTKIRVSRLFNDAGVVGASFLYTQI
ncbi:MAG: ROK family protein [Clostridia bacterium]|nr:ROK family protein [Clostridia bacterium]